MKRLTLIIMFMIISFSCSHKVVDTRDKNSKPDTIDEKEIKLKLYPDSINPISSISSNPIQLENKEFSQIVSPIRVLDDWGYIDFSGYMMLKPSFRGNPVFMDYHQNNMLNWNFNYFGVWWKNFFNSIK